VGQRMMRSLQWGGESPEERYTLYVVCIADLYVVDNIPNRQLIYDAHHRILEEWSLHLGSHSKDSPSMFP
jgi:hypothetical protein